MTRMLTALEIGLYAQNTGEFYDLHCKLARDEIAADAKQGYNHYGKWSRHVNDNIMPRYKAEINPHAVATKSVRSAAAHHLREYYLQHMRETIAGAKGDSK